jgi:hypothetical protein
MAKLLTTTHLEINEQVLKLNYIFALISYKNFTKDKYFKIKSEQKIRKEK